MDKNIQIQQLKESDLKKFHQLNHIFETALEEAQPIWPDAVQLQQLLNQKTFLAVTAQTDHINKTRLYV